MILKKIIRRFIYNYKCDPETYIKHLRKIGCKVGENTKIYAPTTVIIDEQRPWLITIGDNVQITDGVKILTHGYDWSVLKVKYGDVLGSSGKVKIGNNVFIGMNSIILKGVEICDDVIIGAGSLVNKSIHEPGVYAGNPAKFIMSIDDYYEKRKGKQLSEAVECGVEYYKRYNKLPPKEIFREFFWLFESEDLIDIYKEVMELEGNSSKTYKKYNNRKQKFKNYEEFLEYMKKGL